jgi:pimeloyl-ACP methyl ester carboxylesterase
MAPELEYMLMPPSIPFYDFGGTGRSLHFAHANGYPPYAYRNLLELFSVNYHVTAMVMRSLWKTPPSRSFTDWHQLSKDLKYFLDRNYCKEIVGMGHSMGATTTLLLALKYPDYFSHLVLIDPVIFPPSMTSLWKIVCLLGLEKQLHPLAKRTANRKTIFKNKQEMFTNYRSKAIFENIPDNILWDYVNSLSIKNSDGTIKLSFSPKWEALIYETGLKADSTIWKNISHLNIPTLIIKGENSNTFWNFTANRIKNIFPKGCILSIQNSGHLVPFERPNNLYQMTKQFLAP